MRTLKKTLLQLQAGDTVDITVGSRLHPILTIFVEEEEKYLELDGGPCSVLLGEDNDANIEDTVTCPKGISVHFDQPY